MPARFPKADKTRTKAQVISAISDDTGLGRKEVDAVLESLTELIKQDVSPRQVGSVSILGLVKLDSVEQKKTSDRMGRNPATGEPLLIKGKPYKKRGKVRPRVLKALKVAYDPKQA